jgi:hypothetical protein
MDLSVHTPTEPSADFPVATRIAPEVAPTTEPIFTLPLDPSTEWGVPTSSIVASAPEPVRSKILPPDPFVLSLIPVASPALIDSDLANCSDFPTEIEALPPAPPEESFENSLISPEDPLLPVANMLPVDTSESPLLPGTNFSRVERASEPLELNFPRPDPEDSEKDPPAKSSFCTFPAFTVTFAPILPVPDITSN